MSLEGEVFAFLYVFSMFIVGFAIYYLFKDIRRLKKKIDKFHIALHDIVNLNALLVEQNTLNGIKVKKKEKEKVVSPADRFSKIYHQEGSK